jgi:hypothetical protein
MLKSNKDTLEKTRDKSPMEIRVNGKTRKKRGTASSEAL